MCHYVWPGGYCCSLLLPLAMLVGVSDLACFVVINFATVIQTFSTSAVGAPAVSHGLFPIVAPMAAPTPVVSLPVGSKSPPASLSISLKHCK